MIQGLFDILTDLGVEIEIKNKFKGFLSSDVEIITEYNVDIHDYLVLELIDYCEIRQCTFDMKSWDKLIFILKCINKFNIMELESWGDKVLNKLKSEYKSLATEDWFSGFPC